MIAKGLLSAFSCLLWTIVQSQNVGVKLSAGELPNTTLEVNGSISYREGTAVTLANGVNSDITLTDYSFFRVSGPTANFSITGFAGGTNGRILTLVNTTNFALTLTHQATSTAANQINTGGTNIILGASGIANFIYNSTLSNWVVTGTLGSSSSDWTTLGNSNTVDGTNFIGTTDNIPFNVRVNNQKSGRIGISDANTFWGYQTGLVTTASNGTFVGYQAGKANTTGASNTFFGYLAGTTNVGGSANVGVGASALTANTSGSSNTALGSGTLGQTTTGNYNVAVGTQAGSGGTTNSSHVYLGFQAGANTTSGDGNTFVGYNAAQNVPTSTNNTLVGFATSATTGLSNAAAIGANATVTASNSLVLGGTSSNAVNVGIGMTAPSTRLDIDGGLSIRPSATVSLTADNQAVTVSNSSFVVINSDNATATNRTFTLSSGLQSGQILIVLLNTNAAELADSGNCQLASTYTMGAGDTITLIWNGATWYETTRSNN